VRVCDVVTPKLVTFTRISVTQKAEFKHKIVNTLIAKRPLWKQVESTRNKTLQCTYEGRHYANNKKKNP